jgi:hypothetical protein
LESRITDALPITTGRDILAGVPASGSAMPFIVRIFFLILVVFTPPSLAQAQTLGGDWTARGPGLAGDRTAA